MMALLWSACHQGEDAWQQFKDRYAEKGTTIRVNGLMKWGLGIAADFSDDPEARAVMQILRKMKGVEIHVVPHRDVPSAAEVNRLSGDLERHGYASLVAVRSEGTRVNLWARDRTDAFSDPLVLVRDDQVMVMVELRGTLTTEDIQTLVSAGEHYAGNPAAIR